MKNVVIENTLYSFFIYILLKKEWKNDIIILLGDFHFLNIRGNNFYIDEIFSIRKNFIKFYWYRLKFLKFLIKKNIFFNKNIDLYGNYDAMDFFIVKRNIYVLEDGTVNYTLFTKQKKKNIIRKILKCKNPFFLTEYYKKCIKKIYLTGIAPIPEEIKSKAEIINLKKLWVRKNEEERKEILEIFGLTKEKIQLYKKRKYILFTQPLSEDGILEEEEKIKLYRKILANYDALKIIIKMHPREKTKYKEIFKNIEIIEDKFPSELLSFAEIKFEKIITIFSTAALNMDKNLQIDWYGTEVHPKILKEFGNLEKIMKTNAYIKE